jgi:stringent starvation protein B
MLSNRPYLLRAFYQWIVDSNCNPILVIDANHPKAKVPAEYIENGEVVFNISPSAIRDLKMLNDLVEFKASFSGVIHFVTAPIKAILAVYAEENGEGIFFDADEDSEEESTEVVQLRSIDGTSGIDSLERQTETSDLPPIKAKPFLKLVE